MTLDTGPDALFSVAILDGSGSFGKDGVELYFLHWVRLIRLPWANESGGQGS